MPGIAEKRLELAGLKARALEVTPGSDEAKSPLVLLHGWSDSADTWRPLLAELSRRGRAGTALDLPGFGMADRLDRDEEVLPQLDRFVAAAVTRAAERAGAPAVVAGNSLGGLAAMRAAENPDLPLAGIVPIAPAGLDMAGWFPIVEGAPLIRFVLRAPVPLPEAILREAVGRTYRTLAFARPAEVDPSVVSSFTRHVRTKRDVVRVLTTGRRLLGEIRQPFRLDRVACPVLLVWGDQDRMVFSSGADRVLRDVPHARLEVIEHCGHCPQLEATGRVADLLETFPP
jgi:pimeloyl-ACP methyl ester carboxylesterase